MLEKYIETIKPYVLDLFKNDSSGHDISHLERTMNTALYLQEKEGGDKIIIGIASFLHDVHRIMQNEIGTFVSPKDSLPIVKNILSKTDLTNDQISKICFCIEFHEEYNWNNNNVDDINTLILQDADNLDAIGAIGIGRTFAYSGAHNISMYDPSIPLDENFNYSESKGYDESTIHHFYHKLFKLGNNMNTSTAKKLSEKRITFMKEFVKEFLSEWNAEY
ncbi:MAG: HD domain-containing protein [Clostridia bacterium]|nr:HD domain-containing protein [Clostridia bacterium]